MKVGTVDQNNYEDIHEKEVARKRQGGVLIKLLRIRATISYLKTSPLNF